MYTIPGYSFNIYIIIGIEQESKHLAKYESSQSLALI